MTLSANKIPPSQSRKTWLTLAVVAAALVLIPRRSSRQDASDNHNDNHSECQNDSRQAVSNPVDKPI